MSCEAFILTAIKEGCVIAKLFRMIFHDTVHLLSIYIFDVCVFRSAMWRVCVSVSTSVLRWSVCLHVCASVCPCASVSVRQLALPVHIMCPACRVCVPCPCTRVCARASCLCVSVHACACVGPCPVWHRCSRCSIAPMRSVEREAVPTVFISYSLPHPNYTAVIKMLMCRVNRGQLMG